jgi:hypothetical protein
MSNHIRQRALADCGVCAIAIFTNESYERIFASCPIDVLFEGLYYTEIVRILNKVTNKDFAVKWHVREHISLINYDWDYDKILVLEKPEEDKNPVSKFHYISMMNHKIYDSLEEEVINIDNIQAYNKKDWIVRIAIN